MNQTRIELGVPFSCEIGIKTKSILMFLKLKSKVSHQK
jgi:hypothetical protein